MITFNCQITGESQVYDADTIKRVKLEVYVPELEFGAFIIRDVRVNGIDTPELRPRHAGRTKASLERERQASREARQVVVELLSENDNQFVLKNVKYGKYAGATDWHGDSWRSEFVSVSYPVRTCTLLRWAD